jgi:UDP-GlcNAc:undecaprenyl-phosphate GlcNAc-1-phosphate transferase
MKLLLIFICSIFISFFLTVIVRRLALIKNVLDLPNERKIHSRPIPLLGGLAVSISFLFVAMLSGINFDSNVHFVLLGSLLILLVGLLDDLKKLTPKFRLISQLLVVIFLIVSSVTLTIFPKNLIGYGLCFILTAAWVIGLINAVNFLDGMDGLCVGTSLISSLAFATIAFFTGQNQVLILSLILAGCCLGFLPFNFSPAKIFLGDSGSTFLGFMLASIGLLGVWAENNIVGISIPILILGVPIFDMVFTTIMRFKEHKVKNIKEWLEYTGKDHFHHRLVDLGLRPQGAVLFIYLVNICLAISAMSLLRASWKIAILLIIQAATVLAMVGVLMVIGSRRHSGWDSSQNK